MAELSWRIGAKNEPSMCFPEYKNETTVINEIVSYFSLNIFIILFQLHSTIMFQLYVSVHGCFQLITIYYSMPISVALIWAS